MQLVFYFSSYRCRSTGFKAIYFEANFYWQLQLKSFFSRSRYEIIVLCNEDIFENGCLKCNRNFPWKYDLSQPKHRNKFFEPPNYELKNSLHSLKEVKFFKSKNFFFIFFLFSVLIHSRMVELFIFPFQSVHRTTPVFLNNYLDVFTLSSVHLHIALYLQFIFILVALLFLCEEN